MILEALGVLHVSALAGISAKAASYYKASLAHRLTAGFLLIWFSLSVTGYALGAVGLLGSLTGFVVLSLAVSLGSLQFLRRFGDSTALAVGPLPATESRSALDGLVMFASVAIAAVAIAATIILAVSYYPNNFDSLAYRFSRVMLYLGEGDFKHLRLDPRISFYPLTGVFLYLPNAFFGFDGRVFNANGVICWLAGGAAVFALSREMNTPRIAATIATVLFLLAPAVLVSAASTNDDLISGVPLIAAALFAVRWARTRTLVDAVLTGIAFGISFGSKLHFLFYLPVVAALGLCVLWNGTWRTAVFKALRRHPGQIALAVLLTAALSAPALLNNLRESGMLVPPFPENMNKPFSIVSAIVNAILYTTQLFLAQIPDFFASVDPEARKHIYTLFNDFFNNYVFFWVSTDLHYQAQAPGGPIIYQFRSVAAPFGWWGVWEETVWLGLTPWLLALTMVVAFRLRHRQPGAALAFWLCAGLFLWHLGRCTFSKYVEGAGIYYAFVVGPAIPALAWLWQARGQAGPWMGRLITAGVALTVAGDGALAYNAFMFNNQRNIPQAVATDFAPRRNVMSEEVRACLAASDRISIAYTHWELGVFQLMNANMTASYRLVGTHPLVDEPERLLVYSYPGRSEYGHIPVKVAGAEEQRLTPLGFLNTVFGPEVTLVRGPAAACAAPERAGYVVLQTAFVRDAEAQGRVTAITLSDIVGMAKDEALEVRMVQVLPDGTEHAMSGWTAWSLLKTVPLAVPENDGAIKVEARQAGRTEPAAPTLFPLKPGQEVALPPASVADAAGARSIAAR